MRKDHRGPIDTRRTLTPRDYTHHPHDFGRQPDIVFHTPPHGDHLSQLLAETIHQYVVAYRQLPQSPSGAAIARRFGFSKQTWSAITNGTRWPGHTTLIALLTAIAEHYATGQPRSKPRTTDGSGRSRNEQADTAARSLK